MEKIESFIGHKFKQLDDYCWSTLESSKFYFSAPTELNDPADCQIDLAKAFRLARAYQEANGRPEVEKYFLDHLSNVERRATTSGVFSLCSGEICGDGERLFWSHYAKNHTGICMTFAIPYSFVEEKLVGCGSVAYTHDALFVALQKLDLSSKPDFDRDFLPIVTTFLTTKSPEWAYERESRLISFSAGPQEFDRGWLRQICLGLRTSVVDRDRLKELAATYPNCNLVETFRSDHDLYRLELREVK